MPKFAIVPFSRLCNTWSPRFYCADKDDRELQDNQRKAQITLEQAKLRVLKLGIERSNLIIRQKILQGMGIKYEMPGQAAVTMKGSITNVGQNKNKVRRDKEGKPLQQGHRAKRAGKVGRVPPGQQQIR